MGNSAKAAKVGKIVLTGRPITKKNSQEIIIHSRTGKTMVIPSPQYKIYEEACLWELKTYRGPKFGKALVNVQAHYWMPNRRAWPDLLGLKQATADILEAGCIIDNDKYIYSWDGSRICGVDKQSPRAEITITEVGANDNN